MLAVVSVDRDCQITRHHLTSHHSSLASQPLLMEGLPKEELDRLELPLQVCVRVARVECALTDLSVEVL